MIGSDLDPPSRPLWFFRVLLAFVRRELAEASRYRLAFLTRFFAFGLAALSLYFFSRFIGGGENRHLASYGGNYLSFGLIGLAAADLQQVGATTLSARVRMAQLIGFMEAQLSTPAPDWMVLGVAPAYEIGAALVRAVLYIGGAALLFDVHFRPHFGTLALGVPLALLAFGGLGLLSAGVTMVTRRSNPVNVLLNASSALLSGVVYPVSVLPGWLRSASNFLPLTHALELFRQALLADAPPSRLVRPLLSLGIFGVVLAIAGTLVFSWALRRARIDGSLSHF